MARGRDIGLRGRRLKEATRLLHDGLGTLADAGKITGLSTSQHGRLQSQDSPDFANVLDVAEMEAVARRDASWPPVTRLLCELTGGVYLPLPDVEVDASPLALGIVNLMKEFGELAGSIQEGAADGKWEPEELLRAKREGGELQAALAAYLRTIDQMIEAAPPSVAALRRVEGRA